MTSDEANALSPAERMKQMADRISELTYLEVKDWEHKDAEPIENSLVAPSIADAFAKYGLISMNWMVDQVNSYEVDFDWHDSGLDIVMGCAKIIPLQDSLQQPFGKAWTGKTSKQFLALNLDLLTQSGNEYFLLDDATPNYVALMRLVDGQLEDRVYLLHSAQREQIVDLGITVAEYFELTLSSAAYIDWQLALLSVPSYGLVVTDWSTRETAMKERAFGYRQQALHYIPQVFPHLAEGSLLQMLKSNN